MSAHMEPQEIPETKDGKTPQKKNSFWDTVRFVLISLVLVLGFRYFVAQPFIVSGDSMVPTFNNGEYLIVDELSYLFEKPSRGDVIIMRYPLDPNKFFIKRIIGLPGETLNLEGEKIIVTTTEGASIVLDKPYVQNQRSDSITVTLSDTQYYVLGDNRGASSDSSRWGPLPAANIIGRPLLRLIPLSRMAWIPGQQDE